jgi:hypothetical protein
MTDVVWLKHGAKQTRKENEDLSILLDLGALDSYELLTSARCRVIVLTEDSKMDRLRTILEANGFKPDEYMIQPYNGVSNITMSAVVANFFLKQGNNTHVLVHRDGDCMLPDEVSWYTATEKEKLPDRCELFVTPLTDIEHQFCKPDHLAISMEISPEEARNILDGIIVANNASLAGDFANKRAELKNKVLRTKENVPSAVDLMGAKIAFEHVKGKRLFGLLNIELQQLGHNPMRLLTSKTDALKIDQLRTFADRVWPPAAPGLAQPEPFARTR